MAKANIGDTVLVHYEGRLDNGSVFDTSMGDEPLQFTIGNDEVIKGFEDGVIGLSPGESRKIKIPAVKAYGKYNRNLVQIIKRSDFPPDVEPRIGMELEIRLPDGSPGVAVIAAISGNNVTLDANHPMAGKDLNFELLLVEIL